MSSFLPLTLGVRPSSGAEKGGRKARPLAPKQSEKIWRRDDYSCRFCGFRSKRFQRTVPWADEGGDLPYVTACGFCEQCMILERAGMMGTGTLIWLPEIGQAELNHIARAIYVARSEEEGAMADTATRALDALMTRRADAKKRLGSDDPLLLATVLHESLTPDEAKKAIPKLEGIKFLPFDKHPVRGPKGDVNRFPALVQYWCSAEGPFAPFPPDSWLNLFSDVMSKVGTA